MLLICSASLLRHTKQLQLWHFYFSASAQRCTMWSRDSVDASWLNSYCLMPTPVKSQTCDPLCLSHTTIQLLHSALCWCWRPSTQQSRLNTTQTRFKVLTTKANHPHSLHQTSTGKGVERSSLGGLREQSGQAVQTDIK